MCLQKLSVSIEFQMVPAEEQLLRKRLMQSIEASESSSLLNIIRHEPSWAVMSHDGIDVHCIALHFTASNNQIHSSPGPEALKLDKCSAQAPAPKNQRSLGGELDVARQATCEIQLWSKLS